MNNANWLAIIEEPGLSRTLCLDGSGAQLAARAIEESDRANAALIVRADAPHRPLPAPPLPEGPVHEVPGLAQASPPVSIHPAEALRLAGLLAAQPQFDGVVWLCGQSNLWAHLSAGEVVSVSRLASARLLLALNEPLSAPEGSALDRALDDCRSRPERVLRYLDGTAEPGAAAGAILGAELAAARPWWLGQRVIALDSAAAPGWAEICARALAAQGGEVITGDGEAALIAGLQRARGGK
ncbi:2-dehydro-3-deoxygalactonokinase [Sedimentimonas flavescens]|uniref:2-dehydro-3-deoxygalactonokinase n=1 Tax=Sedimentimonas flavescens TaxID=2851012 RepID=UPI0021A44220|nr:2-dehydro-3-deoxygalactonokinase [Sedimentimonas flavescens]MCT2538884.1 2-dehydro-3-deoxygalactonokinase [Sedimentimonas flavescens]